MSQKQKSRSSWICSSLLLGSFCCGRRRSSYTNSELIF